MDCLIKREINFGTGRVVLYQLYFLYCRLAGSSRNMPRSRRQNNRPCYKLQQRPHCHQSRWLFVFLIVDTRNRNICYCFQGRTYPGDATLLNQASSPFESRSVFTSHQQSRGGSNENTDVEFESLDVMLERARKRGVSPVLQIQTFFGAPVIQSLSWLKRGDLLFCLAATWIGAKGFALGIVIGKWTRSSLLGLFREMEIPPLLVQLYPLLLAIMLDQLM